MLMRRPTVKIIFAVYKAIKEYSQRIACVACVLFFYSWPGMKMFQYTIWRLAKTTKADFTVNLESSHCTVISVSHNLRAEASQPQHSNACN